MASTSVTYSGSSLPETITTTVNATPSPAEISSVILDGLGRAATKIAPNQASVTTTYDTMGRVKTVSNPYYSISDPTYGVTSYSYDGLGREISQTDSDRVSTQTWTYSGNLVTHADEAGNQWQQTSDAFGRLTNVTEPGGLQTSYIYDALNNLVTVNQIGNGTTDVPRVRTFTYDWLSRLLCASNPEAAQTQCPSTWGVLQYFYDPNGNLSSKTDGRGITTWYGYDALNRLTGKFYSDGTPGAQYTYDVTGDWGVASCAGGPPIAFVQCNAIGRLTGEFKGGECIRLFL